MSIKPDKWIRRMAERHGMIEPFESGQVRERRGERIISYGTSSYGYDIRCADEFKIFTNINSTIVDPKNFDEKSFVDFKGDVCIIPPNSFALARTVEYFRIPRTVLTICLGKSTYARCGIIVNVTPFEPEWEGYVTLEFSNTTPLPAKIYAGEGCAQVLFFESDEVCETSYKYRGGKYQGQHGVTLPKTKQAVEKLLREPLFGLRCSAYALYASAPRPKIDALATFFNNLLTKEKQNQAREEPAKNQRKTSGIQNRIVPRNHDKHPISTLIPSIITLKFRK